MLMEDNETESQENIHEKPAVGATRRDRVWEALVAARVGPNRAVTLMESQGVTVTVAEAERQLDAARSRNDLRLVAAGDLTPPETPEDRADYALRSAWRVRIRANRNRRK